MKIDSFTIFLHKLSKKVKKKKKISKKRSKSKYTVEDLIIKVSSVAYKDLSRRPPKMKNIFLGLEQRYKGVKDLRKILDMILTQEILKATYSKI